MLVTKQYLRGRSAEYAKKWALSRNPLFFDFTGGGGNCTNFVSQAILAGSCTMNDEETFGWYYVDVDNRSPSWAGVQEFYDFITGSGDFPAREQRVGPFGEVVSRERVQIGDVVQLANAQGVFYHSLLVTGFSDGEILISAQSNDALERPLSTYNYASERFIHISGVNIEIVEPNCFDGLNNGTILPMPRVVYVPIVAQ